MPHSKTHCYEFGPYHLDVPQRVLTRNGETVAVAPKATEILNLLVRNAGQLVEKEDLMREVWPDTFVEEANVSQNIFKLRRALGDDRTGLKFIETVARRGYRFIAPVRAVACADSLFKPPEVQADRGSFLDVSTTPILAVLPFINATKDNNLEYLADGITENIINSLSGISKLRVMSRSAVFRYKNRNLDPKIVGRELGVDAMLVGKINARPSGLVISVELVDVSNGWQLWGESFECQLSDILEIQDQIAMQLSSTLRLKLTGEEEKRITARYTENGDAYQSYLEGRYHWSRYQRKGIEHAITHFRKAIELDPNYALAYAGIVDCYLRLATNYLPPEDDDDVVVGGTIQLDNEPKERLTNTDVQAERFDSLFDNKESQPLTRARRKDPEDVTEVVDVSNPKVRRRYEWDWKGAEREIRRANELKSDYPAAHQWHAAYQFAVQAYENVLGTTVFTEQRQLLPRWNLWTTLTPNEAVQVFCTVAREQIEVGNYDAGCLVLKRWWTPGNWPNLTDLNSYSAADLLFTAGSLVGCLSSTGSVHKGQKQAESLLSGSIGLFEHLGAKRRAAESKIELALSYYRQGKFDLTRTTLTAALDELSSEDELRGLGLIRLGVLERHAGHVQDSYVVLLRASEVLEKSGPLVAGRYHHELATTIRDLAVTDELPEHSVRVTKHFEKALDEFEAIGHHRYVAVVANNYGYLLLRLGQFEESEIQLMRAWKLFQELSDGIRRAQVDDTLARLYVTTSRLDLAKEAAERSVATLEGSDEDAVLADALTTKGLIYCRLNLDNYARTILEGAYRIAERCGDSEGAGRALLTVIEEMSSKLSSVDLVDLEVRVRKLLEDSQQPSTTDRLRGCLTLIKSELAKTAKPTPLEK